MEAVAAVVVKERNKGRKEAAANKGEEKWKIGEWRHSAGPPPPPPLPQC